jgi:hypothetical protein
LVRIKTCDVVFPADISELTPESRRIGSCQRGTIVEPWLPFLNRTLDSLRNLRTRLGNPEREDLVGALLRGFKRNNPSSDAFKIYF